MNKEQMAEVDSLKLDNMVLEEEKLKLQVDKIKLQTAMLEAKKRDLYNKYGLVKGDELKRTDTGWVVIKGASDEQHTREKSKVSSKPAKDSTEQKG